MPDKKEKPASSYLFSGFSFASTLIGSEIAGYYIGDLLDTRAHTVFLFKLVLMIAGVVLSIADLFFVYSRTSRR